jgi:hypothetical protein
MKNHCCLNLQNNGQETALDSLSDFGSLAFLQVCSIRKTQLVKK